MTEHIWKEFHEQLLGFIKTKVNSSETAEDILQEVFMKIHKNIDKIHDNKKTTSWVYQITRNTIIDYYRKKKIDFQENKLTESLPEKVGQDSSDFTQCLKPFITKLPENDKAILLATTYGNISQKEYALKNNLSYSATKSRVQRARQKLKELFVSCCNIESDSYGNIISSDIDNCNC